MSGIDGAETARIIKSNFREFKSSNPEVVCAMPLVICLTAFAGRKFAQDAIANGIDRVAVKPISFGNL